MPRAAAIGMSNYITNDVDSSIATIATDDKMNKHDTMCKSDKKSKPVNMANDTMSITRWMTKRDVT